MEETWVRTSHLGRILDCLSLGLIVLSRDRKITGLNPSAELLTGSLDRQVRGRYCYDIFLNFLCGGVCKYLEAPAADRETLVSDIEITDRPHRQVRIFKIECPLYDGRNRIAGCLEVFRFNDRLLRPGLEEFGNILAQAVLLFQREAGGFGVEVRQAAAGPESSDRRRILDILERCGWNRTEAARVMGINRSTLWRKMRRYGIQKRGPG